MASSLTVGTVPKAVLYYSPTSVWSAVVLLALEEKGYGKDELEMRVVDLSKAETLTLSFLRLNPKGTLPTLVVPFKDTLSTDTESRYKALTTSPTIVQFLDSSRSSLSRTHTTSALPAPTLAPATISYASEQRVIVDEILHAPPVGSLVLSGAMAEGDRELAIADLTNLATYFRAAKKDGVQGIQDLASERLSFIKSKRGYISALLESVTSPPSSPSSSLTGDVPRAKEKVKALWRRHVAFLDFLVSVFEGGDEGKREEYWEATRVIWEVDLRERVRRLNKAVVGPHAFGDQLSLADLHIAAFLARLVKLSGGSKDDDGVTAIGRIEGKCGSLILPRDFMSAQESLDNVTTPTPTTGNKVSKLAGFWDAMRKRESWGVVYGNGLV